MIRITFGFIWLLYKFVFQTDWFGNGRKESRKYAAAGGDQFFLKAVP